MNRSWRGAFRFGLLERFHGVGSNKHEAFEMRYLAVAIMTLALLAIGTLVQRGANADAPQVTTIGESEGLLMRSKLVHSQRVLEGLLRKDFAAIGRGAVQMRKISETAEWPRPRDAVYEHFSAEFRRQCNELEQLAEQRNHQAASYAYLHLTTMCIHCHDHVRDSTRVASPEKRQGTALIPSQWPE